MAEVKLEMLELFTSNTLLAERLYDADAKDQFIRIVRFAHQHRLDWYFTDIPDLRCGIKERNSVRASKVCFRVWLKNQDELLIPAGRSLGFQDTKIPLRASDLNLLKQHIKRFVKDNQIQISRDAFFPDQYSKEAWKDTNNVNHARMAISRMVKTMLATVANSNDQAVIRIMKNKEAYLSAEELEIYIGKLIDDQDGLCAITGIPLQFDGEAIDDELLCSLDRKDSSGHYEKDNLQIVCKFVNRWKSNSADDDFRRLIDLVRSPSW